MPLAKKRLLLKVSGEILLGDNPFGVSEKAILKLASFLKDAINSAHEVALVIGGGNIFRGIHLESLGMERTPADHMGMLATLINGIALHQALQALECPSLLMSALDCPKVAHPYNWYMAEKHLSKGELVIFVGGTGSPYFTTDTAAALRASEMKVDILLKATKVDGVYDQDPKKFTNAKRYKEISYTQYLAEKLAVMDATAIALCMSNKIPVFVFSMENLGKLSIGRLLAEGEKYGTFII